MQGKPTLHYFNTYGRGEPARMAFWKAGVEFNDNRVMGEEWKALKESGKLPYGSMPALELEDGTIIAQAVAVFNYIAELYPQLKSDDPLLNAKAESLAFFTWTDMLPKLAPILFS